MTALFRLLALLALAMQLAAASVVLPGAIAEAASVEALAAATICHGTPAAPDHRHHPVPAVCPLLHTIAQAGALLAGAPPLLAPPTVVIVPAAPPPPARAPPARSVAAPYPRGPPAPV